MHAIQEQVCWFRRCLHNIALKYSGMNSLNKICFQINSDRIKAAVVELCYISWCSVYKSMFGVYEKLTPKINIIVNTVYNVMLLKVVVHMYSCVYLCVRVTSNPEHLISKITQSKRNKCLQNHLYAAFVVYTDGNNYSQIQFVYDFGTEFSGLLNKSYGNIVNTVD